MQNNYMVLQILVRYYNYVYTYVSNIVFTAQTTNSRQVLEVEA